MPDLVESYQIPDPTTYVLKLRQNAAFHPPLSRPATSADVMASYQRFKGEPKNSNSNLVIGSIEPSYMVNERLRLAVNYSFLYRDHNYYNFLEQQFSPAKQKQLVGGSLTYATTATSTVTFRGSPTRMPRVVSKSATYT